MTIFYSGIGSRETPLHVQRQVTAMAREFRRMGLILRSGGQPKGADGAFERGAGNDKLIYLPWTKAWGHPSPYHTVTPDALAIAARFHPCWARLNEYARRLHGRNSYIELGLDLKTKSAFTVCWTKGGKGGGGTGQAIRIATAYGIPVYDLALWRPEAVVEKVRTTHAP